MRTLAALLLLSSLFTSGCGQSGIGSPCVVGGLDQPGNLKVLLGTGECTTNICVSYLGSDGYCTQQCTAPAGCPNGYLCCPVLQTGAMNACTSDAQCTAHQTCVNSVCKPKQFCVQGSGTCQ
jgi:hypothetical protein